MKPKRIYVHPEFDEAIRRNHRLMNENLKEFYKKDLTFLEFTKLVAQMNKESISLNLPNKVKRFTADIKKRKKFSDKLETDLQ